MVSFENIAKHHLIFRNLQLLKKIISGLPFRITKMKTWERMDFQEETAGLRKEMSEYFLPHFKLHLGDVEDLISTS